MLIGPNKGEIKSWTEGHVKKWIKQTGDIAVSSTVAVLCPGGRSGSTAADTVEVDGSASLRWEAAVANVSNLYGNLSVYG
jgi:hypothetical protein